MSLIITSSAKQDETTQLGISIPYQYRNHIKNPLDIPPNSEVAVESVKIQRVPMLDFANNIRANFWFGERLASNASYEDQTSYFIPVENSVLGSKSPEDFADEFKVVLQEAYSLHPEIDSEKIEVSINVSNNGEFDGFHYRIPQMGSDGSSLLPDANTFVQEISAVSASWDGASLEANDDDCFAQLLPQGTQGGPISLHNGSIQFKTGATAASIGIFGLSRPYCSTRGIGGGSASCQGWSGRNMDVSGLVSDHPFSGAMPGQGLGQFGDVYMDYCVENNGTDIRLYNYKSEIGGNVMSEVKYYNKNDGAFSASNGSNSAFTATNAPLPSASFGLLEFKFTNELVEISVSGKTLVKSVSFGSASFKDQICAPTSISNWKMYPTVYLPDDGDKITINSYTPRTSTTMTNNFPENSWIARTKIPTFIKGRGATETQHEVIKDGGQEAFDEPWNNAKNWDNQVYSRRIYLELEEELSYFDSGTIRNYKGLTNNNMSGYENIFIMGKNERYVESRVQTWQANSAGVLGFSPFSISPDGGIIHGGGHGASFVSATRPLLSSQQSTFIRIPTLTHETYNFNTGNPSKILFQIPRFDNSGLETGALFFQNNDKTFIDLKNAAPLKLTDLDVHLVRKDETFAKDLTGSTEVVLVVRKKR